MVCRISFAFVLLAILSKALPAEGFCALTLKIEKSDGTPAAGTWVDLVGPRGDVQKSEFVRGDTYRICDFGFGPHAIIVGSNECHPVTVSKLYLRLGHPILLHVRKNKCEDGGEHTGCDVYLRISDEHGKPIERATVSSEGHGWVNRADEFGRISSLLADGDRVLSVSADGYEPNTFSIRCENGTDVRREIVLSARKPGQP